jgi:hypothetical protein
MWIQQNILPVIPSRRTRVIYNFIIKYIHSDVMVCPISCLSPHVHAFAEQLHDHHMCEMQYIWVTHMLVDVPDVPLTELLCASVHRFLISVAWHVSQP